MLFRSWGVVEALARTGLRAGHLLDALTFGAGSRAVTRLLRLLVGSDAAPLWTSDMPRAARSLHGRAPDAPAVVYVPSCLHRIFGPATGMIISP